MLGLLGIANDDGEEAVVCLFTAESKLALAALVMLAVLLLLLLAEAEVTVAAAALSMFEWRFMCLLK